MEGPDRQRLRHHMTRLAEGDRASFRPVFDLAWPLLERFSTRLAGGNAADGADAAQAALLNVFARASEYDPARDALPWMLAIAANECRTLRRRAGRRREGALEDARAVPDASPTPEEAAVDEDLVAAAAAALGALRPDDARTLALAIDDERACRPVGGATFRKRVQRAVARLRAVWRSRHGTL